MSNSHFGEMITHIPEIDVTIEFASPHSCVKIQRVIEKFPRIPQIGEKIMWNDLKFRVQDVIWYTNGRNPKIILG